MTLAGKRFDAAANAAHRVTFGLICIAAIFAAVPIVQADDSGVTFDADARRWRDTSGKHEINASLVRYHDRQVTLRAVDGKIIDVPIDKLSTSDRVYLARQRRLVRKQTSISEALPGRSTLARLDDQANDSTAKANRGGQPERLFGVDWYSMDAAQKIAQREDKPVMWFRVLGDLSGFM